MSAAGALVQDAFSWIWPRSLNGQMSGPGGPVSQADAATEVLQAVGAAGPAVLHAADHADLPHPVPGPGRPVGTETVLAVERLRARVRIGESR